MCWMRYPTPCPSSSLMRPGIWGASTAQRWQPWASQTKRPTLQEAGSDGWKAAPRAQRLFGRKCLYSAGARRRRAVGGQLFHAMHRGPTGIRLHGITTVQDGLTEQNEFALLDALAQQHALF